jgi:hypothetical protein
MWLSDHDPDRLKTVAGAFEEVISILEQVHDLRTASIAMQALRANTSGWPPGERAQIFLYVTRLLKTTSWRLSHQSQSATCVRTRFAFKKQLSPEQLADLRKAMADDIEGFAVRNHGMF